MSPVVEDPRNYVKLRQVNADLLAVNSKITARNFDHYALASPERSVVFKQNYDRRFRQLSSRGFKSVLWRPYEVVGQPLKLDVKKLVLSTLGQEDQINGVEGSRNEQEDFDDKNGTAEQNSNFDQNKNTKPNKRNFSSASFVMRHRQQDKLRNISKDLKYIGDAKSNVKVGKALFPMLQIDTEQYENKKAKENQRPRTTPSYGKKRLEKQKPEKKVIFEMVELDKEDEEETEEKDLRPFVPVHTNIANSVCDESTLLSIWKQLCVLHWMLYACNLSTNQDGFFQHKAVIPLASCWNKNLPGGSTRDYRALQMEQKSNHKWNKFARSSASTKHHRSKLRKRMSLLSANAFNNSNLSGSSRKTISSLTHQTNAETSKVFSRQSSAVKQCVTDKSERNNNETSDQVGDLPMSTTQVVLPRPSSPDQSSVSTSAVGGPIGSEDCEDEEESGPIVIPPHCSRLHQGGEGKDQTVVNHENLNKLLSTVDVSVSSEMKRRKLISKFVAGINKTIPVSVYDWARSDYFRIGNEMVNISKIVVPTEPEAEPEESPIATTHNVKRPHTVGIMTKRSSHNQASQKTRPTSVVSPAAAIRPRSSPAKLSPASYTFKMQGDRKREKLKVLSEKFHEVNDANALQLHNRLTELGKKRRDRMEVKFESFVPTISFQRDLQRMRTAAYNKWVEDSAKQKQLDEQLKCSWFEKLKKNLPAKCTEDEDCSKVLQRLQQLGAEMSRDERVVTSEAFLNTLRSLRRWEICSPEVLGAVEFVLQEIVSSELTPDEFDEWFAIKIEARKVQTPIGCDSKNMAVKNQW